MPVFLGSNPTSKRSSAFLKTTGVAPTYLHELRVDGTCRTLHFNAIRQIQTNAILRCRTERASVKQHSETRGPFSAH